MDPVGTQLTLDAAVAQAKDIAERVLSPAAAANDKAGRFSEDAVDALGRAGLLGLTVPVEHGGSGLGPRAFSSVVAALADADASVAMVYKMHVCAVATILAARPAATVADTLKDVAAGRHLTTLAFSEAGSRSHFWAPLSRARRNGAGVFLTAKKSWVTSAGHAHSYVVSSLAPEGAGPTDSTLYLVPAGATGLSVAGPWDGLGMRGNASSPMTLEDCPVESGRQLTEDGAGFGAMLNVVLPIFNLGNAAMTLGFCRAAVAATASHLKTAKFEHLGQSLGESLPTLRALLARCRSTPMVSLRASRTSSSPRASPRDDGAARARAKAAAGEAASR